MMLARRIQNITWELSSYFMTAMLAHNKAMRRVMTFCLNTRNQSDFIKPEGEGAGKLYEDYFLKFWEYLIPMKQRICKQGKV
jgi:hypothetical protein